MCIDPATATLVSAGVSAVGSMASGFMHASEAKANAAALESSAQQRLEKGKFDAATADRQYQRETGTVMAQIGTTGVDMQSFDSVLADDARENALHKKAILVGAQIEANNLRFQAAGQKMNASSAIVGGILGAGAAGFKGAGQYAQIGAVNAKTANLGGVALDPYGADY